MKFRVQVVRDITEDQVEDLLVCALEGGSNYWYVIEDDPAPPDVFGAILGGPGVTIGLLEGGDVKGQERWLLDRNTVQVGLERWAHAHHEGFSRFINEDYDALDADAFLQYALFNEIIYG